VLITQSTKSSDVAAAGYRGRFAPSPSGPLHLGSAVAAIASWLDARAHDGEWLLRIDDLDPPRCVPGASDAILQTLHRLDLQADEPVVFQSTRTDRYRETFATLRSYGALFECACSRKQTGPGPYPGTCRHGLAAGRNARATRVIVDSVHLDFNDRWCGCQEVDVEQAVGAFIIRRADGLFAYHLATVVDDSDANISHVLRGVDLLTSTAPQIHLQNQLGLRVPNYGHFPVVCNTQGQKLSKQSHAASIDTLASSQIWHFALHFLGLIGNFELVDASINDYKLVGVERWRKANPSPMQAHRRT